MTDYYIVYDNVVNKYFLSFFLFFPSEAISGQSVEFREKLSMGENSRKK